MQTRGIRGATTVLIDGAEEIILATRELLIEILEANPTCKVEDICSVFFTVSDDLSSAYPAQAARELGWIDVPLLCGQEIPVPTGLSHCIRVLIHWNTDVEQKAIRHIYLREATSLRPSITTR
jgi:chorismate mutase